MVKTELPRYFKLCTNFSSYRVNIRGSHFTLWHSPIGIKTDFELLNFLLQIRHVFLASGVLQSMSEQ